MVGRDGRTTIAPTAITGARSVRSRMRRKEEMWVGAGGWPGHAVMVHSCIYTHTFAVHLLCVLSFSCSLCFLEGGPRSAGWRDHVDGRRRKFDFDFREGDMVRRRAGSEGGEEDRDGLPEWCTDEEEGEMGTFDSSGAFMCVKVRQRLMYRSMSFGDGL